MKECGPNSLQAKLGALERLKKHTWPKYGEDRLKRISMSLRPALRFKPEWTSILRLRKTPKLRPGTISRTRLRSVLTFTLERTSKLRPKRTSKFCVQNQAGEDLQTQAEEDIQTWAK